MVARSIPACFVGIVIAYVEPFRNGASERSLDCNIFVITCAGIRPGAGNEVPRIVLN